MTYLKIGALLLIGGYVSVKFFGFFSGMVFPAAMLFACVGLGFGAYVGNRLAKLFIGEDK